MAVFVCLTIIWFLYFLRSAHEDVAPLPKPSIESFSYTLWTEQGGLEDQFDPSPVQIVPTRADLPTNGWVLFIGADISADRSLPRRLLACQTRYIDVRPSQADTYHKASVDRLVRDFSLTRWTLDPRKALAHTHDQCVWFRAEDFPDLRTSKHRSLGQWRKCLGFDVSLRAGVDEGKHTLVAGDFAIDHGLQKVALRCQGIPLLAPLLWTKMSTLYCLPALGLLLDDARPYATLAFLLMILTRLGQDLKHGYPPLAFVADCFLRPSLLAKLARRSSRVEMEQPGSSDATALAALHRPRFIMRGDGFVLGRNTADRTRLESHIMFGEPSGYGLSGVWIDRWLLNRPIFRGLRWGSVVVAQTLDELKPQKVMSIGHMSIRSSSGFRRGRIWCVDTDTDMINDYSARILNSVGFVSTIDALPDLRFDCVVYQHVAEFLGDAALRRQLRSISTRLAEEGHLIITTTSPHGMGSTLSKHLNWPTRTRTPIGLVAHLSATGYQVRKTFIDPGETQSVLIVGKRIEAH